MAAEYFLFRQIKQRLKDGSAHYFYIEPDLSETEQLKALCRHYNGHIRQRAVLCLGLKREVSAFAELVERVNDWVEEVACSACSSLRRWMRPEFAGVFVGGLPDIFGLLKCTRADHRGIVSEIVDYLGREENNLALLTGLKTSNPHVARLCLRLLLDNPRFSTERIFKLAMHQHDPVVRYHAAQFMLNKPERVNDEVFALLLADRFAPVKQRVLQYAENHSLPVAEKVLKGLLLDSNSLVRQRACRLYSQHYGDPQSIYLAAFHHADSRPATRKAALLGLGELRYPQVLALAEAVTEAYSFGLYFAALNILVKHHGEDARDRLIQNLSHPELAIARLARRILLWDKLLVTLADLQSSYEKAPSNEHALLAYSLAHRLNKWDWLIFLLKNAKDANLELTRQEIARWQRHFNRSAIQPYAAQREKLTGLLAVASFSHLQSYLS